jgi:tRNA (cytidine/uridine-2'-O-)-methyltransferase
VVENPATTRYDQPRFQSDDVFVFGQETRGLPADVLDQFTATQRLQLPMLPANRSLNLSNAVAAMVFEAWRQCDFSGAAPL